MLWAIFSVLAALSWAIVAIFDKYVLTKFVKNPLIPLIFLGIMSAIASTLVYFFHGWSDISTINILVAFAAGISFVCAVLFYLKATKIEEISRIVPLIYLAPIFTLLFAGLFLGEVFTLTKYTGIFLLVAGAVVISSKNLVNITLGKAFWLMLLADVLFSVNYIITKYLLNFADYWTVFSYTRVGIVIAAIPIAYLNFDDLYSAVCKHGKRAITAFSLDETFRVLGALLVTVAASFGPIALVNALASVEAFFVLAFAILLSRFYPKILKEKIGKSTIFLKFIAILLMFLGTILIS